MNRLIEKTVFSGFVTACRLAIWPTRISPSLVKATTEGVMRLPSWLGTTRGSPPSITATTEFVVPRSMPITFPMLSSLNARPSGRARLGGESCLDWDAARAGPRLHLREADGHHAVLDTGLRAVDVEPRRQRHAPDKAFVARLCDNAILAPIFALLALLAADGQPLRGDRELDIVPVEPRNLGRHDQLVIGFPDVHGWRVA